MNRLLPISLLLVALAVSGCGSGLARVSGNVRMDDKPLAEGDIIFEEADKSKTPAAAKITDGKYSVEVVPGMKKVRISASRPRSVPDPVMGAAAREAMIGPEFNTETKLTYEVKLGTHENVDFEVTALP